MTDIWIFGGTTEGRLLAEYCAGCGQKALVSVVSDYGQQVLPKSEYLTVLRQAMDETRIGEILIREQVKLVIDATHPYAEQVSRNVSRACSRFGAEYLRVIRAASGNSGADSSCVQVQTTEEAVDYLSRTQGNILVTTGSKELSRFIGIPDFESRIFARVLPDSHVIEACQQMGLCGKQIIAMQGPFSENLNRALMKQFNIRYLVTKEAGRAGGFFEKLEAALDCGVTAVIIGRPVQEEGITVECACSRIETIGKRKPKKQVFLIGIGMGSRNQMTVGAAEALKQCQVLLGAPRMLSCASQVVDSCPTVPVYLSQDVAAWLGANPQYISVGLVMSGDTGFYSGARKLLSLMNQEPYSSSYKVLVLPGISSVSYLCSRLQTTWEDIFLTSIHGRDCDIAELIKKHDRVFCLTDGGAAVGELCSRLVQAGFSSARITVGEALSYPEERIVRGTARELKEKEFESLAAVLIEKQGILCEDLI